MMKNKILKLISCLFVMTFLFLSFSNLALAKEESLKSDVVRVAWYSWKITGGDSVDNDASKYMDDYYKEIEEKTGLKFKYVPCLGLKEGVKLLAQKKVDLVFGVSYNPVLATKFKFIEPAVIKGINALIKKKESAVEEKKFQESRKNSKKGDYNYLDLKNKKIGVLNNGGGKAYNYYEKLVSDKTKINVKDLKIKVYKTVGEMKDGLEKGEVDYIVGLLYLTKQKNYEEVLLLGEPNFHIITNYDDKILIEKLSEGLKMINVVGNRYNKRLSDKYFPKFKDLIYLTEAEQNALDKQEKLYFYYREGKDFYYKKNADGTESGYYSKFAKKIAELLHKDYQFIPMKYEKRYDYKIPGLHCDVLYDYKFSQEVFHSNLLSKPTMSESALICTRKDFKLKPGISYAGASKTMIKSVLNSNDKIIFTKTDLESLQYLIEGKVDAAIVSGMMSRYVNGLVRYKNIKIAKIKSNINRAFVGVYGVDANFMSAINKAVSKISTSERNEYMVAATNSYEYKPTVMESISEYYSFFIVIVLIIVLSLIIVIRTLFKRNKKIKILAGHVQEASYSKNNFLSRMSHNMRTPLNAIISYAKFGEEENKAGSSKSYFKKIVTSSVGLLDFMKDVLDLEYISKNDQSSKIKKIVEGKLWKEEVKALIEPFANKKMIDFKLITEYGPDTKYLKINEKAKKQIFVNLLINSIKYNRVGGSVKWVVTSKVCKNGIIETHQIIDNGVGMSEEFQKNMFKPFAIEDNSETNKEEGTGLGLAICERTIKELGGKISCESKRGRGTTFTVELINEKPSKTEIENYEKEKALKLKEKESIKKNEENEPVKILPSIIKASGLELNSCLNILVCEDILINSKIIEKILENENIKVDVAVNGKIGVDLVKKKQEAGLKQYDLILMDIRMPIMDGIVATSEIRKLDDKVIIVGLSANAYDSDVKKAKTAGMNDYLAKPINREKFFKTILELLKDKVDFKIKES